MDELIVDRSSLLAFHREALQQGVIEIAAARGIILQASVPHDAYTLTEPGKAAQQGHTQHLATLDDLLRATLELLNELARRTQDSAGNYADAEQTTTGEIQSIQA